MRAAKAYLHKWEEPCLCVKNGAGTIFFSGCQLNCVYCQNYRISAENYGIEITEKRLEKIILSLRDQGADCIELVSGSHYIPQIAKTLESVRLKLDIPVVFNCGGYEKIQSIEMLYGLVDIFMPDLKYLYSETSGKYSAAPDYYKYALPAIEKMCAMTGECVFDGKQLKKGVIVRHLVLPGHRRESEELLEIMAEKLPRRNFMISLMSQYTPFYRSVEYPEINRRVSTYEYNKVLAAAKRLGLDGYMQERSSAKEEYTPDFDLCGLVGDK